MLPLFAIVVGMSVVTPAIALDSYEVGVKLFQKKNYSLSAKEFEKALSKDPKNEKAIYYAGLSYQYLGDNKRALEHFKDLISKFPDSVNSKYLKSSLKLATATASLPAKDFVPEFESVPFTRDFHRYIVVKCGFNNYSLPMIFNTKAEESWVGKNHLQALGIPISAAKLANTYSKSGELVSRLEIPVEVQLGKIRKTINVVVVEKSDLAVLGSDFFGDMKYIVDQQAGLIRFQKIGAQSAPLPVDTIQIPFTRDGKDILVDATIGSGHPIKMCFEFNATTTLMDEHLERLAQQRGWKTVTSVNIPAALGGQKLTIYIIPDIKVGEISHKNLQAVTASDQNISRSILGQDFFGSRQFVIDEKKKVIHFYRR